ncbi:hypothetical protein F511_09467 [Dorcoceras hygrometricum]|uniref:Uncharacterized protein n=1 Tax=Dorcoceras hygrometricum TaxID=472368 RepID=A0A2Z7BLM7_9LAMI|nr:hypothetical protein F511_09467 [Dorcoceras hygrometricum]
MVKSSTDITSRHQQTSRCKEPTSEFSTHAKQNDVVEHYLRLVLNQKLDNQTTGLNIAGILQKLVPAAVRVDAHLANLWLIGGRLFPVVDLIDDLPPPTVLSAGFLVKLVGARRLDSSKIENKKKFEETGHGSAVHDGAPSTTRICARGTCALAAHGRYWRPHGGLLVATTLRTGCVTSLPLVARGGQEMADRLLLFFALDGNDFAHWLHTMMAAVRAVAGHYMRRAWRGSARHKAARYVAAAAAVRPPSDVFPAAMRRLIFF